jgi:hypothetical protein
MHDLRGPGAEPDEAPIPDRLGDGCDPRVGRVAAGRNAPEAGGGGGDPRRRPVGEALDKLRVRPPCGTVEAESRKKLGRAAE